VAARARPIAQSVHAGGFPWAALALVAAAAGLSAAAAVIARRRLGGPTRPG
jgi:hypothetical protein